MNKMRKELKKNGGDDGARTRDLRRYEDALHLVGGDQVVESSGA